MLLLDFYTNSHILMEPSEKKARVEEFPGIFGINLQELLDSARNIQDGQDIQDVKPSWWTQFHTDLLMFKANRDTMTKFILSVDMPNKDDQIQKLLPTMEDARLVYSLHKYSPLREETREIQELANERYCIRDELHPQFSTLGFVMIDCLVCRAYKGLHQLDPTHFSCETLAEFLEYRRKKLDEMERMKMADHRDYSEAPCVLHKKDEQDFLFVSRVMCMLLFLVSKTWWPACLNCKAAMEHSSFNYQHQSNVPCCYMGTECHIGWRGRVIQERPKILEEVAKFLPVEDVPELVMEMLKSF